FHRSFQDRWNRAISLQTRLSSRRPRWPVLRLEAVTRRPGTCRRVAPRFRRQPAGPRNGVRRLSCRIPSGWILQVLHSGELDERILSLSGSVRRTSRTMIRSGADSPVNHLHYRFLRQGMVCLVAGLVLGWGNLARAQVTATEEERLQILTEPEPIKKNLQNDRSPPPFEFYPSP